MAETYLSEPKGNNLGDSGLQEHIAHWAEVLDRWVQSIDRRLGRRDGAEPEAPQDDADVGPQAEP
jgi:hypothetical protein